MAYASANDCLVLTHDLDFGAILAATHGDKLSEPFRHERTLPSGTPTSSAMRKASYSRARLSA